jgi:flagellar biosynthesis protein FliQ
MQPEIALDIGRRVLILTLLITAPLLIIGMVVGVLISLLQAVTQIQEMTLTFVPKLIIMTLAAIVLMPWIMNHLMAFAAEMFAPMPIP